MSIIYQLLNIGVQFGDEDTVGGNSKHRVENSEEINSM